MRLDFISLFSLSAVGLLGALAAPAAAQQLQAAGGAQVTGASSAGNVVVTGDEDSGLAPRGNLWEVGLFGGLLFLSGNNALHDPTLPYADFEKPSPEVGVRIAYLPLSFVGAEGEFMGAAAELQNGDGAIT